MINEQSYGIILLHKKKDGSLDVLIVKWAGYWGFPKWHIEAGETPLITALRELHEETWIKDVTIDESKIFKDQYMFINKKRTINKHVWYFIAYTPNKKVVLDKRELSEYRRCSLSDASDLLTFPSAIAIIESVIAYLGYGK